MLFDEIYEKKTMFLLVGCLTTILLSSCVDENTDFLKISTAPGDLHIDETSTIRQLGYPPPGSDKTIDNTSEQTSQTCPRGFQDNDQDGICHSDCASAGYTCSDNGRCNDSTGVARCDCYAGFVEDHKGNCIPNGFMVTSVSDNLDPKDAEIFSSRLEHLGFSRKDWDQNVNMESLAQYLGYPYAFVYHTGHGFQGGIATSSGILKVENLIVNARNTIFATCFTLKNIDIGEVFGPTAQTIMGYTKQSFDITDNRVVELYADYLEKNNSHLTAWFLANSSIHNLSDRWVAYTREEEQIVEYAGQAGIMPVSWQAQNTSFVPLRNSLLVSDAVLSTVINTSQKFHSLRAMELLGNPKRVHFARAQFQDIEPSNLSSRQAREIVDSWLKDQDYHLDELFFDRLITISKKPDQDSSGQVIAYEFRFGRKIEEIMLRANGPTDQVHVTVGNDQVIFFSAAWSTLNDPVTANPPTIMQAADVLHKSADDIVRLAKGQTVHLLNFKPVFGVARDGDHSQIEPAYAFLTAGGEHIVISAMTGQMLD